MKGTKKKERKGSREVEDLKSLKQRRLGRQNVPWHYKIYKLRNWYNVHLNR